MKTADGGDVRPAQKDWHAYLRSIGHQVIIGKGFADARRQIQALTGEGSPLRRTS
jgi:hypothetical protein